MEQAAAKDAVNYEVVGTLSGDPEAQAPSWVDNVVEVRFYSKKKNHASCLLLCFYNCQVR